MTPPTHVIKRNGSIVPFTPERIANAIYRAAVAVGGRDRATSEHLASLVVKALEEQTPPDAYPSIEQIQDLVEKTLIEEGHARVAKAYILYRDERARQRDRRSDSSQRPSSNIPWAKLWQVLDWAADHEVHTTAQLNQIVRSGRFHELVTASEAAYNEDVENAANLVLARKDEVRMVFIAGPSSSGKTTTTIKVGEKLAAQGLNLVTLNVDHYFHDLAMHPKDEFGDYDFETPQALNMALINEHLVRMFRGEEVRIPFYDFKDGKSYPESTPMRLNPGDVILIDSLHGLYPEMTIDIEPEKKFKLYIEPLLQLKDSRGAYVRWTDIRLMRRMLRDAVHRSYDPNQTLLHWHYVRSSEKRHIIPYATGTDVIVNSAMPYELPLYKARLGDQFRAWAAAYKDDPLREDAFERADRVNRLLTEIDPVSDDSVVPNNSVIREFIGGSVYDY
jgi:uridine kinase